MQFVMVPVPEEHVVDIMQYVARLVTRASLTPWDKPGISELFVEADEATRSLLSVVARATLAAKEVTEEMAADALELHLREIRAIIRDANDKAREANHDPVLALRETLQQLPNGRTIPTWVLVMEEPVARMVRSAEQALREAGSHPLESGPS